MIKKSILGFPPFREPTIGCLKGTCGSGSASARVHVEALPKRLGARNGASVRALQLEHADPSLWPPIREMMVNKWIVGLQTSMFETELDPFKCPTGLEAKQTCTDIILSCSPVSQRVYLGRGLERLECSF